MNSAEVTELLELVAKGGRSAKAKTDEERARIRALMESLERRNQRVAYLDVPRHAKTGSRGGELLWDNYELAYFDRSIDGAPGRSDKRTDPYKNATRPFGIRSKVLGALFSLRYSFQHVVEPDVVVNYVGFSFVGLPASVTTRGQWARLDRAAVRAARDEMGTQLRLDTTIRVDFDRPRIALGPRPLQLVFEFAAGQSPPVTLSTTYVDDRVRLALAAKGGRLVFTRGGLAAEPIAEGWKSVLEAKPVGGRSAAAGLLVALASTAALVPAARRPIKFVALVALTLAALRAADGVRRRLIAA